MERFRMVAVTTEAPSAVKAIIEGPGVEPGGLRRVFRSKADAHTFVADLNSAFAQGVKEGSRNQPERAMRALGGRA